MTRKKKETPLAAAKAAISGLQHTLEATRRVRDDLVARQDALAEALWALLAPRIETAAIEAAEDACSNLEIR